MRKHASLLISPTLTIQAAKHEPPNCQESISRIYLNRVAYNVQRWKEALGTKLSELFKLQLFNRITRC